MREQFDIKHLCWKLLSNFHSFPSLAGMWISHHMTDRGMTNCKILPGSSPPSFLLLPLLFQALNAFSQQQQQQPDYTLCLLTCCENFLAQNIWCKQVVSIAANSSAHLRYKTALSLWKDQILFLSEVSNLSEHNCNPLNLNMTGLLLYQIEGLAKLT